MPRFRCLLAIIWLCCGLSLSAAEPAFVRIKDTVAHPNRVLAQFSHPAAENRSVANTVLASQRVRVAHRFELASGLVLLELEPSGNLGPLGTAGDASARLLERIAALNASGLFRYVEPDYIRQASVLPNDTALGEGMLWGLRNTGQNGGVQGADIDAMRAWDITTGSTNVIVAVIDTGIRYTHRDLAAQMWRNPDEIPANGVDDDQDGYVDNVFGMDAISGSGDPMDDNDHGTHCAGTIGAAANDGNPHVGVAWDVRLMACKFLGADGSGSTSDAIRCVDFAVANGARILSCSWGGSGFSQALLDSIQAAEAAGTILIAAAGNDSADSDMVPNYPSGYAADSLVAVAALDREDKLAEFSNYGASTVDLGAPGVAIHSSTSGSDTEYDSFNGTSMATPHVAGVAALVLARFPDISVGDLRDRLIGTTVPLDSLRGRTQSGGRLNAYHALDAVPDGLMDITVGPLGRPYLIGGRPAVIVARVSDLIGVTNATLTAQIPDQPDPSFRNDGLAPDARPSDAVYSAEIAVPVDVPRLTLTVVANAPGKSKATNITSFEVVLPPANDLFATRAHLSGESAEVTGSSLGAGRESGEPLHAANGGGASVWWTWTAPANGVVTVGTAGSRFDTILGVYTGDRIESLTVVASDDDSGGQLASRVSFAAVQGTTYQIAVDGYNGASGPIELRLRLAPPGQAPVNDLFSGRAALSGRTSEATAVTADATREEGEPMHGGNSGGRSVWWSWTAPADGRVVVDTEGSDFDTLLGVYTGSQVAGLASIAGDDDSGEGSQSWLEFNAFAGQTYAIAVDGFNGASGNARLRLRQDGDTPTPPNDAFAARLTLSGSRPAVQASNRGATREPEEPMHAENAGGASVWWSWTVPEDGDVVIHTAGSSLDTLLAVYTGDRLGNLTLVTQNDQDPSGGSSSRVTFRGSAGVTYAIAVDGSNRGFGPETGAIRLSASVGPDQGTPANDAFANRAVLGSAPLRVEGFNVGATREAGEPPHLGLPTGASVWWTWTAPGDFVVTLDTLGSDFDTTLTVYTGVALDALVSVASNDDDAGSRASRVVFRAAAGISYQIAVDSFGDSTGNISLGLTATPVSQSPPGDFFASPVVISGTSWDLTADNTGATLEFEEPPHDGRLGGASLWWSWMAAESGPVILDTQGSLIDTVLAVYLGDHISSLTAVTANDDSEGGVWSRVNFVAVAGTVYRIAVDGYSGATGPLALHLRQTPMQRAVNDAFADRISISGSPVTVSGTNVGATGEPGEPIHHPSTGGRSVWWSWTALQEGFVDIQTTGSGFDTVLAVYVGDSLPTLDLVGSDDDGGGGQGASRLRFFATAGTTYQIAVDGFSAATGFVQLSLHQQPSDAPPPNDAFANRILLAGEVPLGTARNSGASAELGEPRHAGNEARRSAWWTWTSPRNELVSVTTEGSTFDTVLGVYTGGALADLIRVAANDDTKPGNPASVTTFPAIAGVSYQLVVDSFTGGLPPGSESVGDIVLRVLSFAEAADSSGIAWSLPSLGASWYAQPRTSHEGNGALESPPLLDGESAEVATTVNGPGRLQFWWSVSSEESYDFLRFRINGVELSAISGRTTWTQSIFDLPAGPQVLTWAYQKDASRSEGLDSAWLDGVRFTPAGEVPEIVLHPAGGRLAPGTSHTLVVQVSGPGPFTYLWRKDGTPVPGGNSQSLLLAALEPGLVGDYTVEVTNPFGSVQSNPAHVALLATRGVLVYPVTIAGDSGPWRFEATTEIGRDYRVQYSEDLQDWTDLVQWTSREQVFGFDDSAIRATGVRYFRVVSP